MKAQAQNINQGLGLGVQVETPTRRGRAELVVIGVTTVVVLSITVIILALIFRRTVEAVIFWSFAAAGVVLVAAVVVLAVARIRRTVNDNRATKQQQDLGLRQLVAQTEQSEHQARQAELQAARLELELPYLQLNRHDWAYDLRSGQRIASPHVTLKDVTMLPAPDPQAARDPELLGLINQADCLMVQGGRGSGKTNVALWWLSSKRGQKVVLDPKGLDLNPWPGCWVAQDNNSMVVAVARVAQELRRRQAHGLTREPDIYLFADELHLLVEEEGLPLMDPIFNVITFGREYHVHASFTCSDGGVKSLGIEGRSGLREGLVWVKLSYSLRDNQHRGWIRDGGDRPTAEWAPVRLPGPYRPNGRPGRPFVSKQRPAAPRPDPVEAQIVRLDRAGATKKEICESLGWTAGGKQYKRIEAVLGRCTGTTGTIVPGKGRYNGYNGTTEEV